MSKLSGTAFWMALLFGGAFVSAVFFQGFFTEFLCLALALLIVWAMWSVSLCYQVGIRIPRTAIALALTLYWTWLGIAGSLGRVGYQGAITFWWLGTLPLVFWVYLLSPRSEEIWRYGYRCAVATGVALAAVASTQWLIFGHDPNATFLNRQSLAALLNLIGIPLAGYFLISEPRQIRERAIFAGAIFLVALGLSLIEGRGATLAGGIAFLWLIAMSWRRVPATNIALVVGIIAAAFLIGSQLGQVGIGQRLDTVVENPWEAGATRFVIWKQSWEMLKQAPWFGVGLGHYALYWPPYRDPSDASDGFFVHNDYLQIWIEAGLPGLLLLLAVLITVAIAYARAMRIETMSPSQKVEMSALFAALFAVAAHSFVDFNLYVLSTLILSGFMLGRLHTLLYGDPPVFSLVPSRGLSVGGYRLLTVLVGAFVLVFCLTLGMASFEYRRGLAFAEESRWGDAYATLSRAARYYPYADNVLVSKADLLRYLLTLASDPTQRKDLFDEAEALLAKAEAINPLRAQTFVVRALFYEQNAALVGPSVAEKTEQNYRRALALEPRSYQARYLAARFLLKQGRPTEARATLEDGMKYVYPPSEMLIPYLSFTERSRAQAGDAAGAAALRLRIREIATDALRERRSPPSQGPVAKLIVGE